MEHPSFELIVNSSQSQSRYKDNSPSSFYVELPRIINLSGVWVCNIHKIFITAQKKTPVPLTCIHVELDFIRFSLVYNLEEQIGGTFHVSDIDAGKVILLSSPNPKDNQVSVQKISRIRVRILTQDFQECDFLQEKTVGILRFKRLKKKNE